MEELIKTLYDNLINIVLTDIDVSYHEVVKVNYMNYLKNQYFEAYKDFKDLNVLGQTLIRFEKLKWLDKNSDMKLNLLIEDEFLNKISVISSKAFDYANERKASGKLIDESVAENLINEMKQYFQKVLDFNKNFAQWCISDGIVDLIYASGKSNNTSLRMGR